MFTLTKMYYAICGSHQNQLVNKNNEEACLDGVNRIILAT